MNKLKLLILVFLSTLCINVFASENLSSYNYEEEMQIQGIKKVGPDGYPYLYLKTPISANLKQGVIDDGFNEAESNITKMQIAVDGQKLKKGADIPNQCVVIKGKLFHAENDNHKTKVLIWAEDFKSCD